jgi:CheY-like chemotaxis protein
MFKSQEDQIDVLGVGVEAPEQLGQFEAVGFRSAAGGRRAIDMLRMLSFDLVLVSSQLPDMGVWDFLRHLRTALPRQRWAFVGGPISEEQESMIRMYGATTIFDQAPTTQQLLNVTARLRARAIANVLSGRFGKKTPSAAGYLAV